MTLSPQPEFPSQAPSLGERFQSLFQRKATWVLIDQGVVSAGNFLTVNLLIRNLQKPEWGIFSVLLETLLYLNSLQAALVIYPLLVRGAKSDSAAVGRLASAAIVLTICLLPVLGTSTAISVGVLSHDQTSTTAPASQGEPYIAVAAIAALLMAQLQETTRRALMSQLRFADAVWGDAISYLGQAMCVFVLARLHVLNLGTAFLAMGLTSAAAIVAQALQVGVRPLGFREIRDVAMEFWVLGRWMLINNAGGVISSLSYWWLLKAKHGVDATAAFGVIVALFKLANPVISSVTNLIVPGVAQAAAHGGPRATVRVASRYFLFGVALLGPYFLILGFLPGLSLKAFYGFKTEYVMYAPLLALFVINYAVKYVSDTIGAWLLGLGHSRLGFYTQMANIVATLLVGLPMTWYWGLWGLIVGGIFAITCTALAAGYYLRRVIRGQAGPATVVG